MQVERIEDMKVGDFIQLPTGEWSTNHPAQALYAQAQAVMAAHTDEDTPTPQFQVDNEPGFNAKLTRIR